MPTGGARFSALAWRGLGIAGAKLGEPFAVYRPSGTGDPIVSGNLVTTLPVALDAKPNYKFAVPALHGAAMRYALADGRLLRRFDYLVGERETVFVADLPPLQSIVAVSCNEVLALRRPGAGGGFGAVTGAPDEPGTEAVLATGWPGSLVHALRGGADDVQLPGDAPPPQATGMLPAIAGVDPPRGGDIVVDRRGQRWAVLWGEETMLGWRFGARLLVAG